MATNGNGLASAVQHIEQVWACQVRRIAPVYAITVHDRVVSVAAIVALGIPATTHEWLDVPLEQWTAAREMALDTRAPAIIVARYDDAVVWVAQASAGPIATLCAADCKPRVRIMRNRMTPMRYESRF